jgi:hypothetical protein
MIRSGSGPRVASGAYLVRCRSSRTATQLQSTAGNAGREKPLQNPRADDGSSRSARHRPEDWGGVGDEGGLPRSFQFNKALKTMLNSP